MEEKINYIETNKGRKFKMSEAENPRCCDCALYKSNICFGVYCDEDDIWEEVQQ